MAYRRCECKVHDVPHPAEIAHKSRNSRCTRVVAFEIRRVRDTNGRKCEGSWYAYCDQCARAIRAYQGSDIEMRPAPEAVNAELERQKRDGVGVFNPRFMAEDDDCREAQDNTPSLGPFKA